MRPTWISLGHFPLDFDNFWPTFDINARGPEFGRVIDTGLGDRVLGMARSLAIYHGMPLRERRLRRLNRQLVTPGGLIFDIGAHASNRTRALVALGGRVVAVEPQPDFARLLRILFGFPKLATARLSCPPSSVATDSPVSMPSSRRSRLTSCLFRGTKKVG
jgi:hypothetical protein